MSEDTQILLAQAREEICELKAKVANYEKFLEGAIDKNKLISWLSDKAEQCSGSEAVSTVYWMCDILELGGASDIYIKLEDL